MRIVRILGSFLLGLMISTTFAAGQTWGPLTNQPTFNPGVMLLLTEGAVIADSDSLVIRHTAYLMMDGSKNQQAIINAAKRTVNAADKWEFAFNDQEGWTVVLTGAVLTVDEYVFQ